MMRVRLVAGLISGLVGAVALAVSVSGCGTSTSAVLDPVAQAADVTAHVGGVHMALDIRMNAPALSAPITLGGGGFFNYATREGSLALEISGLQPGAATSLPTGPLRMEEIFKSSALYVGSPLFSGRLPNAARWMKIDLARIGQSAGLDFQQLTSGQANPAQFLEYLKASGGHVAVVGHGLVRGVPTTHYAGTIDLSKLVDVMPSADRAQIGAALSKLTAETNLSSLPVDVWIDAHRHVRRIAISLSLPVAGQTMQMQLAIDLFGFGGTPPVTPPPASEVFDATQTAISALKASGG